MGFKQPFSAMIAVVVFASWPVVSVGQTACCPHCGNTSSLRAACRPVCTTRRVEVTGWDVVEEHVCTSGVCPDNCKLRPRNRLVRKTHYQEVPVVVWTVEYECEACRQATMPAATAWRTDAEDLPFHFPLTSSSMAQWREPDSEGPMNEPVTGPQASPLDGLFRAVRDYVQRQ
jgi:hypothetical protein